MNETIESSSNECEILVLGTILNSSENASIGLKLVQEDDFFDPKHKVVLRAIKEVFSEKQIIDTALVGEKIKSIGGFEHPNAHAYVMNLTDNAGTSVHIESYCDELKKLTLKRQLISIVNTVSVDLKQGADESKIIEKLEAKLKGIKENKNISSSVFNIQPYTLEDLQKELSQTKEGLKTGYAELDEMVRIPNEAITLIGGRPSHGKTTFMLNLFLNLIEQYPEQHFYFFSYEETRQQIAVKIINILSGWIIKSSQNIINIEGYLRGNNGCLPMLERGKSKYQELAKSGRLRIVGESFPIQQLPYIISSLKSQVPLGAVFIDYIQKIKNKERFGTRQLELANTSSIILETAKSHSIPIILGAQLGRCKESKNKLKLDNLREAGDLEQDANLVLGLFNPSMEKAQDEQTELTSQKVDLSITPLKNRNGSVNKAITLEFDRPLLTIKDKK